MTIYNNKEYEETRMYMTIAMIICCAGSIWASPRLWLFDMIFFGSIELLFLFQKHVDRIVVCEDKVYVLYSTFFQKKEVTHAVDKLSIVLTRKISFRGGRYLELNIKNDENKIVTIDSLSGIHERDIEAFYETLNSCARK